MCGNPFQVICLTKLNPYRNYIICKFIYRPERFKVLQKKRDLQNNVWITEDLIWDDREKKEEVKR